MSNIRFQCTLSVPDDKPLYKTYCGLIMTMIDLSMDIMANVNLLKTLGIHIVDYKVPTIDELYDCWMNKVELAYTIACEDSQYNVEFRLTPKYS